MSRKQEKQSRRSKERRQGFVEKRSRQEAKYRQRLDESIRECDKKREEADKMKVKAWNAKTVEERCQVVNRLKAAYSAAEAAKSTGIDFSDHDVYHVEEEALWEWGEVATEAPAEIVGLVTRQEHVSLKKIK